MTRTLIVFGSGPGIGNNVAAKFASQGINHIVLLARNTTRLTTSDAPFVTKSSPSVKVDTLRIDLSDIDSIPSVLKDLDALTKNEDIEVIFFNAARIKPDDILQVPVHELDEDFRTTNLALYLVAQHFIPKLLSLAKSPSLKPALLVTNSHLQWDPVPQLLALSVIKSAQRTMVESFYRAFKDQGIQVGLISCEGVVAPENKVLSPANVAEETFKFWEKADKNELQVRIQEPSS